MHDAEFVTEPNTDGLRVTYVLTRPGADPEWVEAEAREANVDVMGIVSANVTVPDLATLQRLEASGMHISSTYRSLTSSGSIQERATSTRTTSSGPGLAGSRGSTVGRHAIAGTILVLAFGLTACAQIGSPDLASRAADDFMRALATGDTTSAWEHLTAKTQDVVYDNDRAAFVNDVKSTDWSELTWQIGQARDLDISWGVRVQINGSPVPTFLLERRIAGGQAGDSTIILLVQFASRDDYLIAGQGLDERL